MFQSWPMAQFDVDLFVIGGGSGGVRAGRVAAEHGARVAIAEADRWGGTCVIRGCVPKKLFVYASEVSRTLEDAAGFGWTISKETTRFDWAALVAGKDKEIQRLSDAYRTRLAKAGAEVIAGRARLVDPHTIEIEGGRRITAAHVLVAVGGMPRRPAGNWITSDEAFHLPALPKRIAILGGGYIGLEFAHIFAGLGVGVTLVHREQLPLRGFDHELREEAATAMVAHGIEHLGGYEVTERTAFGLVVRNKLTTEAREVHASVAMAAIGRVPHTAELGLAEVGVTLDLAGAIVVDEYSRSSVPHIYAVGDCTGRVALTPVAIREGHAVADTLFGGRPTPVHHDLIPTAVFAQPPLASIGMSEQVARERGMEVRVFKARFRSMRYALTERQEKTLVKLIVRASDDRVVGLHVVGLDAPEIVQAAAIAVTMGATKADFDRTFAMHPTTAEELVLLR